MADPKDTEMGSPSSPSKDLSANTAKAISGDASPNGNTNDAQEDTSADQDEFAKGLEFIMQLGEQGGELSFGDTGEKAADAIDFGDLSDNDSDLPDEEPAAGNAATDTPALTDDASHDDDSLFGDGDVNSNKDDDLFGEGSLASDEGSARERSTSPPVMSEIEQLRMLNFNQDASIPAPAESTEELVKVMFPEFKQHAILDLSELLPKRFSFYMPKEPAKPPKPLHPTRLALEIMPDQEKAFRNTLAPAITTDKYKRIYEAEAKGLIPIVEEDDSEQSEEDAFEWSTLPLDEQIVKGVTWSDLLMVGNDWSTTINAQPEPEEIEEELDDWEREFLGRPAKDPKDVTAVYDVFQAPDFPVPSFNNFSEALAQVAKRPVLDLTDPHLLLDIHEDSHAAKRQKLEHGHRKVGENSIKEVNRLRFNHSNDDAYDALKENHRGKVRATVSNTVIEHSMPAVKLQWPYYRVELDPKELRILHRPSLKFTKFMNEPIRFSRLGMRKRKDIKNMKIQQIFATTKDISLAEYYSSATLLEHSEEVPTVLPNFGMGSKIVNYYRKKDDKDDTKPSADDRVGEAQVLMPQDTSPFGAFGFVDAGETVRSYSNELLRAPIYKHAVKNSDFLICRNTTGVDGTSWYLRNIDNVFSVGQHLPQQVIPTKGARRITTIAKNRMKMLCYRLIRHDKKRTLRIADLTRHIRYSEDSSNRQKMKDFIAYDKNDKVWRMRENEQAPTEEQMRGMIKPEDACIMDAVQAGIRHLRDAGIDIEDEKTLMAETDDVPTEVALAPWRTTKNFADASSGKAMLTLHGEGDPTGVGLGMAFVKISMKGGYVGALQGPSATSTAAIEAEIKAGGGHKYNVKTQEKLYNAGIRDIWDKQRASLADTTERDADVLELQAMEEEETERKAESIQAPTPAFDDSMSQISTEHRSNKVMKITRLYKGPGGQTIKKIEIVRNPLVYRNYEKRCAEKRSESGATLHDEMEMTGDPDIDAAKAAELEREYKRLVKNQARRKGREALKARAQGLVSTGESGEPLLDGESPAPTTAPTPDGAAGRGLGTTTRKCANCGQAGHIKTNKKYKTGLKCLYCLYIFP